MNTVGTSKHDAKTPRSTSYFLHGGALGNGFWLQKERSRGSKSRDFARDVSQNHTLQGMRREDPSMRPKNRAIPRGSSMGGRSEAKSGSKGRGPREVKVVISQGTSHQNTPFKECGREIPASGLETEPGGPQGGFRATPDAF